MCVCVCIVALLPDTSAAAAAASAARLRLQGFTGSKYVQPTHAAIQEALVALGDKKPEFVGSKKWIGAVEISMILGHWCVVLLCCVALRCAEPTTRYGLDCRILDARAGDIASRTNDLGSGPGSCCCGDAALLMAPTCSAPL